MTCHIPGECPLPDSSGAMAGKTYDSEVCPLPLRKPEVDKDLDELSKEFTDLITSIKAKLTEDDLAILKKQLLESVAKLQQEEESFLAIKREALDASTVNNLIDNLTAHSYWSHMCPESLSYLVKGIESVHSQVSDYEKKLASFKEKTKLKSLANCCFPVPKYCIELQLKLSHSWADMALDKAEKSLKDVFKRGVAGYNPTWRLKNLKKECIIVYALLEEGQTKHLIRRERLQQLCKENGVIGFTLKKDVIVNLSEGREGLTTVRYSKLIITIIMPFVK